MNALGARTVTTLDEDGRVTSYVDPNRNEITASYSDDGLLLRREHPDGTFEAFEYNDDEYVIRRVARSGDDVTYAYDDRGLLVRSCTCIFGNENSLTSCFELTVNRICTE